MEQQEYQEKLLEIRQEIDEIDAALLPLFIKRMQCSERVAAVKRSFGAPVLSAQREQEILDRVREQADAYGGAAAALYAAIMSVSRARQHQLLQGGGEIRSMVEHAAETLPLASAGVVCQGVEGAYSHQAAQRFFGERSFDFAPTWKQVFEDVKSGRADFGVLPVENSAAGSVTDVYDLILQYRFFLVGAVSLKVEHCLAACPGTKAADVKTVVSHPQALAQCSDYLDGHGILAKEFSNTAAAAQHVSLEKPENTAAVCSETAAEKYGLSVLEQGIQNMRDNCTRFVVISRIPVLPKDANKISLCFSLPHTTGSLYHVLERFSMNGLNLTKIESRPLPGSHFEYDFYLDFAGNLHEEDTLNLICSLHDELPRFSFLGNYSEI